jgi:hypothetical protein
MKSMIVALKNFAFVALKNQLRGAVAGGLPLIPRWTLVGEVTGLSRSTGTQPNQADSQLGLRYALQPTLVLDMAASRSLRSSGTKVQATIGLTWTVDILGRAKR